MLWISVCLWVVAAGLVATLGFAESPAPAVILDWLGLHIVVSYPYLVAAAVLAGLFILGALLVNNRSPARMLPPELAAYGLQRAIRMNPRDFVPRYISGLYIKRSDNEYPDADQLARQALHLAADASRLSSSRLPLGICVFGRPMQGKTRLAWEAMQAELPTWTFLLWPHRFDHRQDVLTHCGPRVVLWLDELQAYATPWGAAALEDLFGRLVKHKDPKIQFVVVATCRSGADELAVRSQLGQLVDRLTPIWPADLTPKQVDDLREGLAHVHDRQHIGKFDGRSPGSLVLDVGGMQHIYDHDMTAGSRHVLWALKLLRSAGTYFYPTRRVLLAATHFKLPYAPAAWTEARDEIEQKEFVRIRPLQPPRSDLKLLASLLRRIVPKGIKVSTETGEELIEPMSAVYLESIVHEHHLEYSQLPQAWPELLEHMDDQSDAEGLINLGQAFFSLPHGDLHKNRHHAVLCFTRALAGKIGTRPINDVPDARAAAQCGLGDTLLAEAEIEAEGGRVDLLREAARAYRVIIKDLAGYAISTRMRARAQHGLGRALAGQADLLEMSVWPADTATLEESGKQVAEMLTGAIKAFQDALILYAETGSASLRAGVLTDLAEAHAAVAARMNPGADAQGAKPEVEHLRKAIDANEQALLLYTPQSTPLDWANTQQRLGDILRELASRVERTDAENLYDQSVSAYHAALSVYTLQSAAAHWAEIQESLGDALFAQASRRDDEASTGNQRTGAGGSASSGSSGSGKAGALAKQAKTLGEAASAYGSALRYFQQDQMPMRWAGMNHRLARVYVRYAEVQATRGRFTDASELLEKARVHLTSSTATEQFTDVESARQVRDQIEQIGSTIAQIAKLQ
jgi:tetratricopeptide (TPR) repeat protein